MISNKNPQKYRRQMPTVYGIIDSTKHELRTLSYSWTFPSSFDPRAMPARIDIKIASFAAVIHEIDCAISPCCTAPGNRSGIVHAHRNLISKSPITKKMHITVMAATMAVITILTRLGPVTSLLILRLKPFIRFPPFIRSKICPE